MNQPYKKQWFMDYFNIQIHNSGAVCPAVARFKRNRFTRRVYIFQSNCAVHNRWNEAGYGWGNWVSVCGYDFS